MVAFKKFFLPAAVAATLCAGAVVAMPNDGRASPAHGRAVVSSNLVDSENVIEIAEGQTVTVPAGVYDLRLLRIGKNGTLVITGSADMFVDKLELLKGSRIRVAPPYGDPQATLTLTALDASGTEAVLVEANGVRVDKPFAAHAPNGKKGQDANDDPFNSRNSRKGGRGRDGQAGAAGGHAGNIVLNLYRVSYGTSIEAYAVGADGQNGQGAGRGGRGGDGTAFRAASNGGPAGTPGMGGRSGDAGQIIISLAPADRGEDSDDVVLSRYTRLKLVTAAGRPGQTGAAASGNRSGAHGFLTFENTKDGSDSPAVLAAEEGAGPRTNPDRPYAVVRVLDPMRLVTLAVDRQSRKEEGFKAP